MVLSQDMIRSEVLNKRDGIDPPAMILHDKVNTFVGKLMVKGIIKSKKSRNAFGDYIIEHIINSIKCVKESAYI